MTLNTTEKNYNITPTIGISAASLDTPSATAMLKQLGAFPCNVLPLTDHANRSANADIALLDGLILMGNNFDIDPEHYVHRYPENDPRRSVHPYTKSERNCINASARADYENALLALALEQKIPLLCICGGMQRLNVLCGGTLLQHIADDIQETHSFCNNQNQPGDIPIVPIIIESGTTMAMIARKVQMSFVKTSMTGIPVIIMENSFRHQSIDNVGEGLRVCAISDTIPTKNGAKRYLIEAIEAEAGGTYRGQFVVGVQWHPEFNASGVGRELVSNLTNHAIIFSAQKQ